MNRGEHHPPAPSSEEEGVGGGGPNHKSMLDQPASAEAERSGGPTRKVMLARAADMRRNLPEPERRLWMELRASRFYGFKFRRQAVIGGRIVDFFCPTKGLVIEIDGVTHDAEIDAKRDRTMSRATGYRIVRFTNEDVMRSFDGVLLTLKMALDAQSDRWSARGEHHPPTPSSEEEGE